MCSSTGGCPEGRNARAHTHTQMSRSSERARNGIDHRRCRRQGRKQVGQEGTVQRTSSVSSDSHTPENTAGRIGRGGRLCGRQRRQGMKEGHSTAHKQCQLRLPYAEPLIRVSSVELARTHTPETRPP
jgi:hypothetical protein